MEKFGKEVSDTIEWSGPRLLCIAGDFTKYDQHAVQQINRNIELIRYRRYGDSLLLFELVNATTAQASSDNTDPEVNGTKKTYKTVSYYLGQANPALIDLLNEAAARRKNQK